MSEEEVRETEKLPAPLELPGHFCPVCSSKLESKRCKMVCPKCGYFMSCSEFD